MGIGLAFYVVRTEFEAAGEKREGSCGYAKTLQSVAIEI